MTGQLRLRVTRQGWDWLLVTAALLTTGLYKGINLITLLACLLLVLWVLHLLRSRRRLRGVGGNRFLEEPIFAGAPFTLRATVNNPGRAPEYGLVIMDQWPEQEGRWMIPTLAGQARANVQLEIIPRRRGLHAVGPLVVSTTLPFGLAVCSRELAPAREVVVLPRLGRLHRGRLRQFLTWAPFSIGRSRHRLRRHPAAQAEVHGLRPFRPGDSTRWIHWRTTARKNELMVREFEEMPADNLILVLDPEPPFGDPGMDGAARVEDAVSLAATVCWEWCRQTGDRLVLVAAGADPVVLAGVTGRELALRLLRCLALTRGGSGTDVGALRERLAEVELPAAPVLVVSAGPTDLADVVAEQLRRPVAAVNVSDPAAWDFFERGTGHAR
jgi:uncharacterized protein (DUF58 family)